MTVRIKDGEVPDMLKRIALTAVAVTISCLVSGCGYGLPRGSETPNTGVLAQGSEKKPTDPPPEFKPYRVFKITKEGGWLLPDFKKIVANEQRHLRPREGGQDGGKTVETFEVNLELNQKHVITLDDYALMAPNQIGLRPQPWLLESAARFEVKGRTFCYIMYGVLVDVDSSGRPINHYLAGNRFAYYDEDGDGIFETLEQHVPTPVPHLPAWVVQRANSP